MLLSLVTSHELSMVIPLVGRLALFGGGLSLCCSMRNSLLVWVRRVDFSGRSCWLSVISPRFFFSALPGGGGIMYPSLSQDKIFPPSLSRGGLLVGLPILDEPPSSLCGGRRLLPTQRGRRWVPPSIHGRGPFYGYSRPPLLLAPLRHQGRRWTPHPFQGGGSV